MASSSIILWQTDGEKWKQWDFIFLGSKITADQEIERCLLLGRRAMTNVDSILKTRDIILLSNFHLVKAMVSPVVMYGYNSWDCKVGWVPKNWHIYIFLRTDIFKLWCWRRLLRVPWTTRRSNQSFPKGNQPWIFVGRTDAEVKLQYFGSPDAKSQLTGKDPDAGKVWGEEEKRTTEDEVVGWHNWLSGRKSEQMQGYNEGQGSLSCYSPRGHRVGHHLATEKNNK